VGVAVGACAVCCAGPLVALVGGIGVASTVGAWFMPVLIVLAVLALAAVAALWWRRRRAACSTSAPLADLGMPAVPATGRAVGPGRGGRR
jgi:mercuric ion transport protein